MVTFLAIDGFVGVGVPEEILLEIEKKFLSEGTYPNKLSLMFAAGFGMKQRVKQNSTQRSYKKSYWRTLGASTRFRTAS